MSRKHERQIKSAMRQIAKEGKFVTWRIVRDGAPADPLKPWLPGASVNDDRVVKIAFFPTDLQTLKTLSFSKGSEIVKGCVMGFMAASGFEPNLKDIVIDKGRELRIIDIDTIAPAGIDILHIVIFQK